MIKVIGVTGLKYSGKTTVSRFIQDTRKGQIISFATPLKKMLLTLGLTEDDVFGKTKEVTSELLCGHTPRWAMQSLGTEWGRKLIGEDIWVNAWEHQAKLATLGLPNKIIIVDDLRFPNELDRIKYLGGHTIRVRRAKTEQEIAQHESEAHVLSLDVDFEVNQVEGDPDAACMVVDKFLNDLCFPATT